MARKQSAKQLIAHTEGLITEHGLSGITLHLFTPLGDCPRWRGVERHSIEIDGLGGFYLVTGDGYSDGTAICVKQASAERLLKKFWKMPEGRR